MYSLNQEEMNEHAPVVEKHRGPLSYMTLHGIKDIVLQSTGKPMDLAHVQFGPCAEQGKAEPQLASQLPPAGGELCPGPPGTQQATAPFCEESSSMRAQLSSADTHGTQERAQERAKQLLTEAGKIEVDRGLVRGQGGVARPAEPLVAVVAVARHHHQVGPQSLLEVLQAVGFLQFHHRREESADLGSVSVFSAWPLACFFESF